MLALVLPIGLMFMAIPKGFDMTHEQIGKGKMALVFVYDPNLSVSISQTEEMNKARDELGDKVIFLIAKIGTPEGEQFIAKYRANVAELLLFNATGKLIQRQYAQKSANELMTWFTTNASK